MAQRIKAAQSSQLLRDMREKREMSLVEVGSRIGVTRQRVGQYEQGVDLPTMKTFGRLVEGLEMTDDEIVAYVRAAVADDGKGA